MVNLGVPVPNSDAFLRAAYRNLEFEGSLLFVGSQEVRNLSQASWLEQAQKLNAESVFFVQDNPTAIFFKLDKNLDTETAIIEEEIRQLYLKVWNTSRLPIFFITLPTELRVYSAFQKPLQEEEWFEEDRWLERVQDIALIAETFADFSRPSLESGYIFERRQKEFDQDNRVDSTGLTQ